MAFNIRDRHFSSFDMKLDYVGSAVPRSGLSLVLVRFTQVKYQIDFIHVDIWLFIFQNFTFGRVTSTRTLNILDFCLGCGGGGDSGLSFCQLQETQ